MSGEDLRLAVVVPELNVVSESFIRAHIHGLSEDTVELWGSPRALYSNRGGTVLSGAPFLLARGLQYLMGIDSTRAVAAVGRRLPTSWYERQVAEFLRRVKADVVLAEYGPTGVVVMNACARAAKPLVVHFHGYDAYQTETVTRLIQHYNRNDTCPIHYAICNIYFLMISIVMSS